MTEGDDRRDDMGRLYAAFDPAIVIEGLGQATLLHEEELASVSSNKIIRRVIARR